MKWWAWVCLASAAFVDPLTDETQLMNEQTFVRRVRRRRGTDVHAVAFFKQTPANKEWLRSYWNELAKHARGQVVVAAVDCTANEALCLAEGVDTPRLVRVYPPAPQRGFDVDVEARAWKDVFGTCMAHVPGANVRTLDAKSLAGWLDGEITVPKVLLISDKPVVPSLYKAISNKFVESMRFGYLPKAEASASMTKWGVSTTPHLRVFRHGLQDKVYPQSGKVAYTELFAWLNVYSETFATGGGFHTQGGGSANKSWLTERFPELTLASHQDVCFKNAREGLCVVALSSGPLSAEARATLASLQDANASSTRGAAFRWMWLDASAHPAWAERLGTGVAVINPHKTRPRFLAGPLDQTQALLDKVTAGDARFTSLKPLPKFGDAPKDEL